MILDGVEDGQTEVLVEDFTRQFKAAPRVPSRDCNCAEKGVD